MYCSTLVNAQNATVVSGTILDSNGLPYSGASVQAQLVPATGVTPTVPPPCNGQSSTPCVVSGFQRATADGTGTFSMNLASNAVLSPGGTQWQFTVNETGVAPPLGTGSQTCSATFTISGASQSVSANLSTCPALTNVISPVRFDASAQTAAIGSTTLFTSIAGKALYRISMHARVTTTAGTSSTLGPVTVSWTDAQSGAQSSVMGSFNSSDGSVIAGGAASGNLTTTKLSGVLNIDPGPSTPVTFTVGYASNPASVMQYAIHLRVELLGTLP